jgi:hypothetical protein
MFFSAPKASPAESDLDAFMQQVVARRDDNWRKLQQYILDERERVDIVGPRDARLWAQIRDYTWYMRDGFFVRSPVRVDGAEVAEADRRKYESEFLARAQRREQRARERELPQEGHDAPAGIETLIQQSSQPQFISSAYFLRFRFEGGRYALVGREMLDGREVVRVEYYPSKLYTERQRREVARKSDPNDPFTLEVERMLNKVALVTLWIEPAAHQIIKYTFDNVDFDFLPGRWFARLDSVKASMSMGQPFPDVWLPHGIDINVAFSLARGRYTVHYTVDYHDYKLADVNTVLKPGQVR